MPSKRSRYHHDITLSNDNLMLIESALKRQAKAGFRPNDSLKLMDRISWCLERIENSEEPVSVVQLAGYIIAFAENQSIRLRSYTVEAIAYILQGEHLAHYGRPLFFEKFTVTNYTVKCPAITDEFLSFYSRLDDIDVDFEMLIFQSLLTEDKIAFIDRIIRKCLRIEGRALIKLVVDTEPVSSRCDQPIHKQNDPIPEAEIKEYFTQHNVLNIRRKKAPAN